MKTLRPFGVTFTPKPGTPKSQWTTADRGVGNASIALFVNLMRGIAGTCLAVLPSTHIGSTANEMAGPKVIRDPRWRKQNQCVMNRQQSTSISGKDEPENHGIAFTRYLIPIRGASDSWGFPNQRCS